MAITEDASTPAVATGTGAGNLTTAAFTPPANTLVVAMVGLGWGSTGPTVTVTSSEGGGNWTVKAQQAGDVTFFGMSHISYRYYASSPGSITVTAAFTNLSGGRYLNCRVLNNTNSVQTGGASAVLQLTSTSTNATWSITTTTTGAQVYGLVNDQDSDPTFVAAANTTLVGARFDDTTDSTTAGAFKATSAVGAPGATTLGITLGATNKASGAMMEVMPATAGVVGKFISVVQQANARAAFY